MIVLVTPESETEEVRKPQGHGRMAALAGDLAKDPRPIHELSPKERDARLEKIMGVGRGLMSTSEEFAKRKLEEIELEEQKFLLTSDRHELNPIAQAAVCSIHFIR